MFRRTFAILLAGLLLLTALGFRGAEAQSLRDREVTEKIRAKVSKTGVGVNARVEVKLRNNSQLRGYIRNAGQDSFSVVESGSCLSKTISYSDTQSVKKVAGGMSGK